MWTRGKGNDADNTDGDVNAGDDEDVDSDDGDDNERGDGACMNARMMLLLLISQMPRAALRQHPLAPDLG